MIQHNMKSLATSIYSLNSQTNSILSFIENNFLKLILYPSIIEADIDIEGYCNLLKSIRDYEKKIPDSQDNKMLKEKLQELIIIEKKEFTFNAFSIPSWIIFILIPIGFIVWIAQYFKLSDLKNKLHKIKGKVGTIDFVLKPLLH
jgi:hypothetical protein